MLRFCDKLKIARGLIPGQSLFDIIQSRLYGLYGDEQQECCDRF